MTGSGRAPAPGGATGDSTTGTESPSGASAEDLSGFDRAITDLQGKIADLRTSVDDLGQGPAAAPPPAYAPPPEPPPAYAEPPPAYAEPPPTYAEPEQPPAYQPSAAYETEAPASGAGEQVYATGDPYAAPPAYPEQPAAYAEPRHYGVPAYGVPMPGDGFATAPPPAGSVPAEGSDALASFFRVDVGPFEDLLSMTAFEEQLSALPSMADVRVRRFGGGRAEIELEMAGPAPLAREMRRVAPDAETVVQPDGTLTVDLHGPQWTGGGDEQQETTAEEPAEPAGDEAERSDTRG